MPCLSQDEEREAEALAAVARQGRVLEDRLVKKCVPVSREYIPCFSTDADISFCVAARYEVRAGHHWNVFYQHNSSNFYKDRHYLQARPLPSHHPPILSY